MRFYENFRVGVSREIVTATSRPVNQDGVVMLVMDTVSTIRTRETAGEYAGDVE